MPQLDREQREVLRRLVDRARRREMLVRSLAFEGERRIEVVEAMAAAAGVDRETAEREARRLRREVRPGA
jgi:hypothetical protein